MKKETIFILLFAFFSLISMPCAKAADISVDVKIVDAANEKICVSGTISPNDGTENRYATVFALPTGTAVDTNDFLKSALAYGVSEIKSDGAYSFTFGFSQPDGIYDFCVLYDGEIFKTDFNYISLNTCAELIKKIADGTVAKSELVTKISEYEEFLPINMEKFKTDFAKTLLEYRLDKKRSEISVNGDSKSVVESFGKVITDIENEMSFVNNYNEVTYYGSYYKLLYDNVKYTKIDFTVYNSLSNAKKERVWNAMLGTKAANADEIKTLFDECVNSAYNYEESTGGGGSNKTGGGSGFSGRSVDATVVPDVKKDTSPLFDDIYGVAWAGEAITRLAEMGVVSGTAERIFEPNENVTREQFAKMICGVLSLYDENAQSKFNDVSGKVWYVPYVASIENVGIINGVGDNNFGIGQYITRQDMAVMIYNALKYKNVSLTDVKNGFGDYDEIADYAKDAVSYLAGAGIVNGVGNGNFEPSDNATRAESAVLIYALHRRIS